MDLNEEIKKCFPLFETLLNNDELEEFKRLSPHDLLTKDYVFGLWIRNNLIYPENSILRSLFLDAGTKSPDEMSAWVMLLFHEYLNQKKSSK